MDIKTIENTIITPTLKDLGLFSDKSLFLLSAICAHESKCGKYLDQIGYEGTDQGLGLYAMQSNTATDLENYFHRKIVFDKSEKHKTWWEKAKSYRHSNETFFFNLKYNHVYGTALCRLFFIRFDEPLPPAGDIEAAAKYWKKYYNTRLGKGTVEKFVKDWEEANA